MAARPGAEGPGIHRERHPVAVADRKDEQADEQPWMPAAAQTTQPPCLTKGRQILAETRDRLVGSQRAVREPG